MNKSDLKVMSVICGALSIPPSIISIVNSLGIIDIGSYGSGYLLLGIILIGISWVLRNEVS